MNILFVNDIPFNPIAGGIERVTDILTRELIDRGYTIYYLCGKLHPEQKALLEYDYPALLYLFEYDDMFENQANIAFYQNLQRSLKIDIVVNQRGLGGRFNAMLPYTQAKLVSVVHSVPDAEVSLWLNKIVELTVPPCINIKKLFKKIFPLLIESYWRKKAVGNLKVRYGELAKYSDKIVMLSDSYYKQFEDLIDRPYESKLVSIPNPNTFNITDYSLNNKEKVILYVGRLVKLEKEPLRLLKIWKRLHRKYPSWKLVIVGDGEEKSVMHDYIKRHRLINVYFEGRQLDVQSYYKKASFICLTSNFEGWGMVLTEGMQHGCIPFTFDNYGAAFDIIDNGVSGCLVSAFNLRKYATCLSRLMRDDLKRVAMSKAAIDKVNMFSVSKVADKWEYLFHQLVNEII